MNKKPIDLRDLSDDELIKIVDDLQKPTIDDDSVLRELSIQYFGSDLPGRSVYLSMVILPIVTERMRAYSPHILKN